MKVRQLITGLSLMIFGVSAALNKELLLVTIATNESDGLRRYLRSVKQYNLTTKVFGIGEKWLGGDMTGKGGGHKVNILRKELEAYKDRDDLVIMFTDSKDVVMTDGEKTILEKFAKLEARVVFSAECRLRQENSLWFKYPEVEVSEKLYLSAGGFIGHAKDVYEIVNYKPIDDSHGDQLYYTEIFLDPVLRERWNIKLDKVSDIFVNLYGALGEVVLQYQDSHSFLYNKRTGTVPVVVHGDRRIQPEFNRLANYLADGWTINSGCLSCNEQMISLDGMLVADYPNILLGIFVEEPTPFVKEFLELVTALDYPKEKLDVIIHSTVEYHQRHLLPFIDSNVKAYKSLKFIKPSENVSEANGRNTALKECKTKNCHYYFSVDADTHLDNDQTLKLLIKQNRSVLAPMISGRDWTWSNFWGALCDEGFFAESEDYSDIVNNNKTGLWNIPYITGAYLIHGHLIPTLIDAYYSDTDVDADVAFCKTLRDKGIFMHVTNRHRFGHLIDTEDYDTSHFNNDMFDIFNNPVDWEKKYIHPNYSAALKADSVVEQPCPDVFWFPIVTDLFCDELIAETEHFGKWSGGKRYDPNIEGGQDPVPSDDVHLADIGMKEQWLHVLEKYVSRLVTRVFPYYDEPPEANLNFVVKYHPQKQSKLRPHHDQSTYTINIGLNTPRIDYEGGGCRFVRYNCSVTDTRKGWMLLHPGKLTHLHEGLQTTAGTRYIMVSFVDP